MNSSFDIIVIGGGHAGVEAVWSTCQMNLSVCLISSPESGLASAPCNPAIGGVGKGQVVREIDALGGLMGKLADYSGIQYRTLNESKGYAVQSTRVQIDKEIYSKRAEEILSQIKNLTIIRDFALDIKRENDYFIISTSSESFKAKKVIITTGTFLNAKLHLGDKETAGGRVECRESNSLAEIIKDRAIETMRFKTGTPPRLLKTTIDYSKLLEQKSDSRTRNFSSENRENDRNLQQVSCFLANTNSETLSAIRDNKHRSPLFNGQIKGVGPRYCPSIEDKAFRYVDKDIHHVFIEPEGLSLNSVYPNGLSTSLPKDVQEKFIRSIHGLEAAEILVYGYAVEYDVIDTSFLGQTLEHKNMEGLYFAGQVCGTSGYEEAAGQGIIAGINAGLSLRNLPPMIIERSESYIGVMIEDLILNKRDEPYRLFTARSENRLFIREDNTLQRMSKYRKMLDLNQSIDTHQEEYLSELSILEELLESTIYYNNQKTKSYFERMNYGSLDTNTTLAELIKRGSLDAVETLKAELQNFGAQFRPDIIYTASIGAKYEGYINRSLVENEKLSRLSKKPLNIEKILESVQISFECKSRIKNVRPSTFGQLQKMEGIRPATLAFVAGNIL